MGELKLGLRGEAADAEDERQEKVQPEDAHEGAPSVDGAQAGRQIHAGRCFHEEDIQGHPQTPRYVAAGFRHLVALRHELEDAKGAGPQCHCPQEPQRDNQGRRS